MPTALCPHCGKHQIPYEAQEAARVFQCSKCGGKFSPAGAAKLPAPSGSSSALISSALLLMVVLACGGIGGFLLVKHLWTQNMGTAVGPKDPDITLPIIKLLSEYHENVLAADVAYKGKTIRVEDATFTKAIQDGDRNALVFQGNGGYQYDSLICFFDKVSEKEAAKLAVGSRVSIVGVCKGRKTEKVLHQDQMGPPGGGPPAIHWVDAFHAVLDDCTIVAIETKR